MEQSIGGSKWIVPNAAASTDHQQINGVNCCTGSAAGISAPGVRPVNASGQCRDGSLSQVVER
jgi:hypothetical protein